MSDRKTCPRSPDRPCHRRRLLAVSLAVMGLVFAYARPCSSASSPSEKPEVFRDAIKAQDQENWSGSIPLLQQALKMQPEDGERVRIYGTRYASYLPYYYLGLAFYKRENCTEALKEWEQSLNIGAVQKTEEHKLLLAYWSECRNRT